MELYLSAITNSVKRQVSFHVASSPLEPTKFYIHMQLNSEIYKVAKAIQQGGGNAILVGGAVRDHFFGQESKDLDIEVYNVSLDRLQSLLSQFGKVNVVGKSFGVMKLKTESTEYDISYPRKERKTGKGHKGFMVEPDPKMTFAEAASRRDFTINAMGYDILNDKILDPFNGRTDFENKILRHVGPAFAEDPLRVLRAMQFAGRFEFDIASETVELCRQLDLSELPKERYYEEFKKLLLRSKMPSHGLRAAHRLGVFQYFPELLPLVDKNNKIVEGKDWVYTLNAVDKAALTREGDDKQDIGLMFGALCHRLDQSPHILQNKGKWEITPPTASHDSKVKTLMFRITSDKALIEQVYKYVIYHKIPKLLFNLKHEDTDSLIRRLAVYTLIPKVVKMANATSDDCHEAGIWLERRAHSLDVLEGPPEPFLRGRHLLDLGMPAGPDVGKILKDAYQLQLDGVLTSPQEALQWARQRIPQ